MTRLLGIETIGIDFGDWISTNPQHNVILRVDKKNPIDDNLPHLIVSNDIRTLDSRTDLFQIDPFHGKNILKRKAKSGLGVEIAIAPVRKLDASLVAKWLQELKSIYDFCKSNYCQFILSSGATSINEMISARSIESILNVIGINPGTYWTEISGWLYLKSKARWQYAKS